jgi:hypothetical protein
MSTSETRKVPAWFWIASAVALLWEGIGVASYLSQVNGGAAMNAAQRELVAATPAWVTGAYATAAFSGLLGAIALLLRKRWARSLFILSLIAAIVQFGWVLVLSPALDLLGPSAAILPIVILIVGAGLVWLAGNAERRGWLT